MQNFDWIHLYKIHDTHLELNIKTAFKNFTNTDCLFNYIFIKYHLPRVIYKSTKETSEKHSIMRKNSNITCKVI